MSVHNWIFRKLCARQGITSPITPDLMCIFDKGALLVQCPSDAIKDWLDELVRKRQSEFGRIGYAGVIASLVEQGIPSDEAASEFGHIGYAGAIASLVEQGVPLDEAALEFGRIGYSGMIASLVEEGIPLEEAAP